MSINRRFPARIRVARTRIWSGLYILDRMVSVSHGRPLYINDEDCDGWNFNDLESQHSSNFSQKAQYLLSMMQISRLHGDVQKLLYHHDTISDTKSLEKTAVSLAERLASIECRIPDYFKLDTMSYPSEHSRISAALQLFVICSNTHLLLTRQFFLINLLCDTLTVGNSPQSYLFLQQADLQVISQFSSSCVEGAARSIDLLQQLIEQNTQLYKCPSMV